MNFTPGRGQFSLSCPTESLAFPLKLFIKHLFPLKKQNSLPIFSIKHHFLLKKQNSPTVFSIKRHFSPKKQNFSSIFSIKCLFPLKIQNFPAIFFITCLFLPKKQNFSEISLKCSGSCNSFSTPPHRNINDCISHPNPLYLESLNTQTLLPAAAVLIRR